MIHKTQYNQILNCKHVFQNDPKSTSFHCSSALEQQEPDILAIVGE